MPQRTSGVTTTAERKRRSMRRWRPARQLLAFLGRYFWLPCPACGEMFSGHEATGPAVTRDDESRMVTCPACALESDP